MKPSSDFSSKTWPQDREANCRRDASLQIPREEEIDDESDEEEIDEETGRIVRSCRPRITFDT